MSFMSATAALSATKEFLNTVTLDGKGVDAKGVDAKGVLHRAPCESLG